ncbi:hypothetical protein B7L88_gp004 [Rhizobium phage RHEph10]|uniref:hypothetical protein n=1 Tax=Rhizobium phage RHEph10 TaxID=1220717 RepID=UPI0002AB7E45|nr:hypothetical protein B7L88_gp004 [Rhizobium phage RHEph10]AGC36048.1 hypothetical protein RHEph10_gp004 [Rhizobium phage RHEph10]
MNYLKIVSKGWQGYTGQLNIISFKNGVSTEPVPPRIADRIAASVQVVECDAKGKAAKVPVRVGVQHRLITETAARAAIATSLETQTDADKSMEAKLDAARSLTAPVETLFTRPELEKIADDSGMKGLRDIGDKWTVKGRGIPELIEKILVAQSKFLQLRNQKMDQAGGSVLKATTLATAEEEATVAVDETPAVAGYEGLPAEYHVGDVVVPGVTLIEFALKNSGKSLTGWNALRDSERKTLIDQEVAALEEHYGAKLEPVVVGDAPADETLLGSSVLASSYEIDGKTVTLGELVAAAHTLSGATVAEWNELAEADREDLIRAELDRRLPKE